MSGFPGPHWLSLGQKQLVLCTSEDKVIQVWNDMMVNDHLSLMNFHLNYAFKLWTSQYISYSLSVQENEPVRNVYFSSDW